MKKIVGIVAVSLVILIAGLTYINNSVVDHSEYFRDELIRLGVERGGMPIEGFTAPMYLNVFPGLTKADFDGVRSFEGIYNFNATELMYKRTAGNRMSSAEQTISDAGYRKLLKNISKRLNIVVTSASDVTTILEKLK